MSITLEQPTFAELLAEDTRLWRICSETFDALAPIKNAAKAAIADSRPVSVSFPHPYDDTAICTAHLIDGWLNDGSDASLRVATAVTMLELQAEKGAVLTDKEREALTRWTAAKQESEEIAAQIRQRIYDAMGYDAAKAAYDKAEAEAQACNRLLLKAPIRTMADAIAALEYDWDYELEMDTLRPHVLAFLRERAA